MRSRMRESASTDLREPQGSNPLGPPGRDGQRSSSVYLVVRGDITLALTVPTRGAVQFQTVGSGELLGWTPVLGLGSMTATASVQTPSTLLVLNAADLHAFCTYDLSFGFAFMQRIAQVLASRLSATRLLLMDLYHEDQMPARMDRIS